MKSVNTDVAYDYIRKRVLNGQFPPGSALMTGYLAEEIKVSRTPIRDALRKLEADGLVEIRPHLGATVKSIDIREFREMCDLRLALESHAAGLAARNRTDADLREIRNALETMGDLVERIRMEEQERPLLGELAREDARFHLAIMEAAKSHLMKKEIVRLHLLERVLAGPDFGDKPVSNKAVNDARRKMVQAKHADIYHAIAASDSFGAKRAMEYHLHELIEHDLGSRGKSQMNAAQMLAEPIIL